MPTERGVAAGLEWFRKRARSLTAGAPESEAEAHRLAIHGLEAARCLPRRRLGMRRGACGIASAGRIVDSRPTYPP